MSVAHEHGLPARQRALRLILEAIDLLDAYDGPPQASAHLELAAAELRLSDTPAQAAAACGPSQA